MGCVNCDGDDDVYGEGCKQAAGSVYLPHNSYGLGGLVGYE